MHSSSAPVDLFSTLRAASPKLEKPPFLMNSADGDKTADDQVPRRFARTASLPALVFSSTLQKCTRPFDFIRKEVF